MRPLETRMSQVIDGRISVDFNPARIPHMSGRASRDESSSYKACDLTIRDTEANSSNSELSVCAVR